MDGGYRNFIQGQCSRHRRRQKCASSAFGQGQFRFAPAPRSPYPRTAARERRKAWHERLLHESSVTNRSQTSQRRQVLDLPACPRLGSRRSTGEIDAESGQSSHPIRTRGAVGISAGGTRNPSHTPAAPGSRPALQAPSPTGGPRDCRLSTHQRPSLQPTRPPPAAKTRRSREKEQTPRPRETRRRSPCPGCSSR